LSHQTYITHHAEGIVWGIAANKMIVGMGFFFKGKILGITGISPLYQLSGLIYINNGIQGGRGSPFAVFTDLWRVAGMVCSD
jgi:hypothetical protein